ncbi:MAG: HlyC/CorC family transporter [Hyphomonadaceae bacterium]|nr:HlyC/CorC family transporter [Hyphomonadaceae bacterium]
MTSSIIVAATVIVVLILLNAFFSLAETALTAASRARMMGLEKDGDRSARRVIRLVENRERMIGAVLLGANFVTIAASAIASTVFVGAFGDAGPIISTLVLTPLLLIFGEVMPKTWAISNPDPLARAVSLPVTWMVRVLAPVVAGVTFLVRQLLSLMGVKVAAGVDVLAAREEIIGTVDLHHEEGAVEQEVRNRLRGAFELGDLTIADVMVHRRSMKTIEADLPPREIIAQAMASPHTRLPVWRDDPDNIIGVLHARDLLRAIAEKGRDGVVLEEVMREPWFVPETAWAEDQLAEFLKRREHFAIVVDEFGALQGLVTLEDIIEEIVGDIKDEHDVAFTGVRPQPDGSVNVDGAVPIRDLNRAMDWDLPDEEAVTVAGLVIHESQTIPDPGQVFSFHGYRFHILRRQRNAIAALRIEKEERADEGG